MIVLHQFPAAFGMPNVSPFCLKAETFLKMAGLTYQTHDVINPTTAPRGKLPYLRDGDEVVADSQAIIEHIKSSHGIAIDGWLSDSDEKRGHFVRRVCEDSLYFAMLYGRWVDDDEWPTFKEEIFAPLPPGVRSLIPLIARRRVDKQLRAQGIGLRPKDEVYRSGREDLDALASHLGDQPYILGDRISSFDATAFAFLSLTVFVPVARPLRTAAEGHPNIVAYCQRLRDELFGEPASGRGS